MAVTKTLYLTSNVDLINGVCCAVLSETNSTSAVAEASDYAIYVDVVLVSPAGAVTTLGSAGLTGFGSTVAENSVTITPTSRDVDAGYAFGIRLRLVYSDSSEFNIYFLDSPSSERRYIEGDVVVTYYSVLGSNGAYYVYFGDSAYPSRVSVTFVVAHDIVANVLERVVDEYGYRCYVAQDVDCLFDCIVADSYGCYHYERREVRCSVKETIEDLYSKVVYAQKRIVVSASERVTDTYSWRLYESHRVSNEYVSVIRDDFSSTSFVYHRVCSFDDIFVSDLYIHEYYTGRKIVSRLSEVVEDKYLETVYRYRNVVVSAEEVIGDRYSYVHYVHHDVESSYSWVVLDRYSFVHYVYHDVEGVVSAIIQDSYDAVLSEYHLIGSSAVESLAGLGDAELMSSVSVVATYGLVVGDMYVTFKGRLFGCRALLSARKRA